MRDKAEPALDFLASAWICRSSYSGTWSPMRNVPCHTIRDGKDRARQGASMATRASTKAGMDAAKKNKRDEFYTQLPDIEAELRHYRPHFEGKTVLCNCDDPYESNFFKYFTLNFRRLGIKKLIASCYAGSPVQGQELSLFDLAGMTTAEAEAKRPYKVEICEIPDANGDGAVDLSDVEFLLRHDANVLSVLEGDGDFRSDECVALLEESDIVVTNPPFSLFREYIHQLMEYEKKFLVIGNQNAITYKEIFPLIAANKLWLGHGFKRNMAHFYTPYAPYSKWIEQEGEGVVRVAGVQWFTNMDLPKRHENIILVEKYNPDRYPHYDNYDAIEVSKTADIPENWTGAMGVPITFLNKYSPEQFEILGIAKAPLGEPKKIYPTQTQVSKNGSRSEVKKLNDGPAIRVDSPPEGETYYIVDGQHYMQKYARILIRRIGPAQ